MKKVLILFFVATALFAGDFTRKHIIDYYTWLHCAGCPGVYYDISSWVSGMGKNPHNYILLSHYYDKVYHGEVTSEAFEYTEAMTAGFPAITINRSFQTFGTAEALHSLDDMSSAEAPFALNFQNLVLDKESRTIKGNLFIEVGKDTSGSFRLELITARDSVLSKKKQANGFTIKKGHPLHGLGNPAKIYYSHMIAHNYIFPKYGKESCIPFTVQRGDTFTIPFTYTLRESDELKNIYLVAWINKDSAEIIQSEIAPIDRAEGMASQFYPLKKVSSDNYPQWEEGAIYKAGTKVRVDNIIYNTSFESNTFQDIPSRIENRPADSTLKWLSYWLAWGIIDTGSVPLKQPNKIITTSAHHLQNGILSFTKGAGPKRVSIYNLHGQNIISLSLNGEPQSIIVTDLVQSTGLYTLVVKEGIQVSYYSFIKK